MLLLIAASISSWLIVLLFNGIKLPFSWDAIKEIPAAACWITPLVLWFYKTGWKFRIFRKWLVLVPDLNGTWKGKLTTTWVDPNTNTKPPPKDVYLVIRQKLNSISCVLLTNESKSYSRAATIQLSPDGETMILEFTYSNQPRVTVSHRSNAHDGASSLDIITNPSMLLKGKYWNDRNFKGELELHFQDSNLREIF